MNFLLFSERKNPNKFLGNNYNYNDNFNNYNQNNGMMNFNGMGFPPSERSNNSFMRNRYQNNNSNIGNDYSNSNHGSPGFNNIMGSNYPKGSILSRGNYGRFSGSNINLNNNQY